MCYCDKHFAYVVKYYSVKTLYISEHIKNIFSHFSYNEVGFSSEKDWGNSFRECQ